MNKRCIFAVLYALLIGEASARNTTTDDGVALGPLRLGVSASAGMAYDTRIGEVGTAADDIYTKVEAGMTVRNRPARYNLTASANYGYRFYSEFDEINDDSYTFAGAIKSTEGPFKLGLSSDFDKSLEYQGRYDPSTGEDPDLVFVNTPNQRWITKANIGYDRIVSSRISIMPQYSFLYYDQRLTGVLESDVAEWQTHEALLAVNYYYSDSTMFSLEGVYAQQINKDDNGKIATLSVKGASRATDKTVWRVKLGVSSAEYEVSESRISGVSDLRISWKATGKVSIYGFGGNNYQPGYGGGAARMIYRAGYGLDWDIFNRVSLGVNGLHNYEEDLGNTASDDYGDSEHYHGVRLNYLVGNNLAFKLGVGYTQDEQADDRLVATIEVGYSR